MKRLRSIDVLRGLACLGVLFYHIPRPNAPDHSRLQTILFLPADFGDLGVPLFLLISGFCIHGGAAQYMVAGQHSAIDWGAFWRRRFWRLYPPYVVMIGLSLTLLYSLAWFGKQPFWYKFISVPWDLVTHLLLIHNLFTGYRIGLGNPAFWSLGLEEQLYALYAVYLLLCKRLPPARVLLIATGVLSAWRLLLPFFLHYRIGGPPLELGVWDSWPFGYWGFWVAGALAAEARAGALELPTWCYRWRVMWSCFAAGTLTSTKTLGRILNCHWGHAALPEIARVIGDHLMRLCNPALFVAGFFVLMNIWVRREAHDDFRFRGSNLLARLGVISYSLYLTHMPVMRTTELFLSIPRSITGTLIRYFVYTPLCLLIALAFFWTVERHFLKPLQKRDPHRGLQEEARIAY